MPDPQHHPEWDEETIILDSINPPHYKTNTIEAIDVIEAFKLDFNLGNAVKYILRCGKKDDPKQELQKAKWYIERELSLLSR